MKTSEISINDFLKDPETNHDRCYNFFDWFCSDKSLKGRMMKMVPKLRWLVKEGIIDGDTIYVWFKNNCPMNGSLYDDMRFSTQDENNDFMGGICPRTGHYNIDLECKVWYFTKDDFVEHNFTNWSTFKKEMKNNQELKQKIILGFKGEL